MAANSTDTVPSGRQQIGPDVHIHQLDLEHATMKRTDGMNMAGRFPGTVFGLVEDSAKVFQFSKKYAQTVEGSVMLSKVELDKANASTSAHIQVQNATIASLQAETTQSFDDMLNDSKIFKKQSDSISQLKKENSALNKSNSALKERMEQENSALKKKIELMAGENSALKERMELENSALEKELQGVKHKMVRQTSKLKMVLESFQVAVTRALGEEEEE
jgi:hypothetical protein